MNLETVRNFRDIGGIPTKGHGMIRQGIVYRSANPDSICKEDLNKVT